MRDPKHLGRDLAERMVVLMRTKNVDVPQALRRVAGIVAGRANNMVLAEGMRRQEVASWVGEVQAAYAQRLEEHLMAAGAEETQNVSALAPDDCSRRSPFVVVADPQPVRLTPEQMERVDAWRAAQKDAPFPV